jgi:hypothetical protein
MPWHISDKAKDCSGYAVVLDSTSEVVGCHKTKKDAEAHLAALYANVKDVQKMQFGHGSKTPFYIEFNTPDAQGMWAVCKENNSQVLGVYSSEEEAKIALDALTVQVDRHEEKGLEEEATPALSFWNGSFAPVFGTQDQDARYNSTYNAPPNHDGKKSTGYGNSSGYGYSNQ